MFEIRGRYTKATVMIDNVEDDCVKQIQQFVDNPVFVNPVVVMPDTHSGKGSVIGFTMKMSDKIIPNTIGVDIGCGMESFNIDKITLSLEILDHRIRQRIPFGQNVHEQNIIDMVRDFPWHDANVLAEKFVRTYDGDLEAPHYDISWFLNKSKDIGGSVSRMISSLGTLGGGNHFIEVGVSQLTGKHWVTIHSGSRNFGKRVCEYWQHKAEKRIKHGAKDEIRKEIDELKTKYQLYHKIQEVKNRTHVEGVENGLEWLEGDDMTGYLFDMLFAQVYAHYNRQLMKNIICDILNVTPLECIQTVHNFIDFNDHIIRKGAIRSYMGEKMIIPFNMRDGILVCEGKSNSDWNCSAPHGAGRTMSRSQAKKRIKLEEFKTQMTGIYSTSVCDGTLDEAPEAYKDSEVITNAIEPTAIILDKIRPIHNMKDSMGNE